MVLHVLKTLLHASRRLHTCKKEGRREEDEKGGDVRRTGPEGRKCV
jgi:hypothetical protein